MDYMVGLDDTLIVKFSKIFTTNLTSKIIERLQILAYRTVKPTNLCQLWSRHNRSRCVTAGNIVESLKLLLRHPSQLAVGLVKLRLRNSLHYEDIRSCRCIYNEIFSAIFREAIFFLHYLCPFLLQIGIADWK